VSNAAVALLTVAAGVAGSLQVAVMGRFGDRIGVFEAFAFSAATTALIAAAALLIVRQSAAGYERAFHQPWWLLSGGVWGAVVVITITLAAPRIGTFATIGIFLAGQLAMGAVIDRWGLFGLDKIPVTPARLAGLVLLAVGAALTLKK
jgi:transporter family-2 protein